MPKHYRTPHCPNCGKKIPHYGYEDLWEEICVKCGLEYIVFISDTIVYWGTQLTGKEK